jgi:hypothetical protein
VDVLNSLLAGEDEDAYYAVLLYGRNLQQKSSPIRLLYESECVYVFYCCILFHCWCYLRFLLCINVGRGGSFHGNAGVLVVGVILGVFVVGLAVLVLFFLIRWRLVIIK